MKENSFFVLCPPSFSILSSLFQFLLAGPSIFLVGTPEGGGEEAIERCITYEILQFLVQRVKNSKSS
jgi:uncharacterized protein (DUF1786 family)